MEVIITNPKSTAPKIPTIFDSLRRKSYSSTTFSLILNGNYVL